MISTLQMLQKHVGTDISNFKCSAPSARKNGSQGEFWDESHLAGQKNPGSVQTKART
tara:strand:+ start:489 stop:659 length:171 start_codon:yes stop_codon:yes gene_type:complete